MRLKACIYNCHTHHIITIFEQWDQLVFGGRFPVSYLTVFGFNKFFSTRKNDFETNVMCNSKYLNN